ncbi:MAG: hypothetical protein ACRDV9_01550 [Acidimicrobiia bacterium]
MGDSRSPGAPSRLSLTLAFLAMVLGGLCGATIGFGFVNISCQGDCGFASAAAALVGGACGAGGVAVVSILMLRASAERRRERPSGSASRSE